MSRERHHCLTSSSREHNNTTSSREEEDESQGRPLPRTSRAPIIVPPQPSFLLGLTTQQEEPVLGACGPSNHPSWWQRGGGGLRWRHYSYWTSTTPRKRQRPNHQTHCSTTTTSVTTGPIHSYHHWACCLVLLLMILGQRAPPTRMFLVEVRAFGMMYTGTVRSSAQRTATTTTNWRRLFVSNTSTSTDPRVVTPVQNDSSNDNNNNLQHSQHLSSPSLSDPVELCHTEYLATTTSKSLMTTTRPPALFLHGLLGNKRNFASIARSLGPQLEHPRRIVGLDLRNHGVLVCVIVCKCA
jgi:hypothetical protein